jgi:hypothetical protein
MFPLTAPAHLAKGARELLKDLGAELPADQEEAKLAELDERLQELRDSMVDGHGLRLDGTILHPALGVQVWFDVSAMHTTCKTHLRGEVKFTRERRAAGKEDAVQQSSALMEAHQRKQARYALLAVMVERQALDGLRTAAPLILPVIISTHGELCPGTVQLQEWLTKRYRARLRLEGDRDDGEKEDDLVTAFRCWLRASLLVAVAKGTAKILAVAGRPFRKGGALGGGARPGARAPAARAAGDDTDDSSDSEINNIESDSNRSSGTGGCDARGSGDRPDSDSSSIAQATSHSESNGGDSEARGGSGARGGRAHGGGLRGAAPRGGTLIDARTARRLARQYNSNPQDSDLSRDLAPSRSSSSIFLGQTGFIREDLLNFSSSSSSSSCSCSCSSSGSGSSSTSNSSSGSRADLLLIPGGFPILT